MIKFEWKDIYILGDFVIDAQHQHLFEIAKALVETEDIVALNRLTLELFRHTRDHFEYEEDIMRQHHYPGLAVHIERHNELLNRLNTVSLDVGHGKLNKPVIEALMVDWVITHITYEDAEFSAYVQLQHSKKNQ